MIKDSTLYRNNYEGIYLQCLDHQEACNMIEEFHEKYGTSHGSADATAHQILKDGYYWPSIFKDTHENVCHYHTCQTVASRERNPTMPLQLVFEVRPFAQWELGFIGVINPNSYAGHKFILTAIDYCT